MIRFQGNHISEIRPFYFDPAPFIEAGARRDSTTPSQE